MIMLYEFLKNNKNEILHNTQVRTLEMAGARPSSDQLRKGLPIFYQQLIDILVFEDTSSDTTDHGGYKATDNPAEVELSKSAGRHGSELMRLGYSLSHVVHAYGAMCQSITELLTSKETNITPSEFHHLNRCLDVAISGAVTNFQAHQIIKSKNQENEHLGFLAHELRNTLMSINLSFEMIKMGSVGAQGSTSRIMDSSIKRMQFLIDQSLSEVRLNVDPIIHPESVHLLELVNEIRSTAQVAAHLKQQLIEVLIEPSIVVEVDQQLLFSAVSNLIQNAIKYSHENTTIKVRGFQKGSETIIEVEDECGGLTNTAIDLFKPFEQQNQNREGLGLGLTIAQKAISLSHGAINVRNLPKKGCIFQITIPTKAVGESSTSSESGTSLQH